MNAARLFLTVLLAVPFAAAATDVKAPEKQIIELKDGGTLVITRDGKMSHYDKNQHPVKMANGTTMEAKDGTVFMMRNNELWQRYWMRGTMKEPGSR